MKHIVSLVTLCLLMAGFVLGLAWVCHLRFERGDIYPRYSSHRSDPLGTRGLYEALNALPQLEVTRNYRPWNQTNLPSRTTWIVAGVHGAMHDAVLDKVKAGARVVLCYNRTTRTKDADPNSDISFGRVKTSGNLTAYKTDAAPANLPQTMPWLNPVTLIPDQNDWQVVYSVEDQPVILERAYGQGTLVALAHPYLLSNEAMLKHRQASLITWLCGSNRSIAFDETIHHIIETPGIMTLARELRLQGLAAGLLCVAILFVWSRTRILTRQSTPVISPVIQGRTLDSGLADLLERHTPKSDLLPTCYAEWAASLNQQPGLQQRLKHKQSEIARLVRATAPDQTVTQYNLITEIISKKDNYDTRT